MLDMLEMLKVDLGIVTSAYDTRLTQYISYAKQSIKEEGATLDLSSVADMQLVAMYAGWLWRRRDTGEGMPRMLRYALNNKVLGGKANG